MKQRKYFSCFGNRNTSKSNLNTSKFLTEQTKQNSVCITLPKDYMAVANVSKRNVKCFILIFFQYYYNSLSSVCPDVDKKCLC